MGCIPSSPRDTNPLRPASIGEVAVFVPGFRIPRSVDLTHQLRDYLPENLLDRLSALRMRIVALAADVARQSRKAWQRTTTRHGPMLAELLLALEEYLPVLLGLVKDGYLLIRRYTAASLVQKVGQLLNVFFMIVPDSPSERVMNLPTTRKMALKNKIVFGTGDRWHAPTLTANMGFVRAVSQTSMSLLTVEHKPRALTGD